MSQELNTQVTILRGQSNYLKWKRQFKAIAETENLLTLFTSIDSRSQKVKEEKILPKPVSPQPPSGTSITAEQYTDFRNRIEVFKFLDKAYEKQQTRLQDCKRLFAKYVDPTIYPQIAGISPVSAWNHLKMLSPQPTLARTLLTQEIRSMSLANFSSVQEYVSRIMEVNFDLYSINSVFNNAQVIDIILAGLSPRFNRVVEDIHFQTGLGTTFTCEQIISRLLTFEHILKTRQDTSPSNNTQKGNKNTTKNASSKKETDRPKDNPLCPNCKKYHPGGEPEC